MLISNFDAISILSIFISDLSSINITSTKNNRFKNMLEMTKSVLKSVSFDSILFQKELKKATNWIAKEECQQLKIWCLASFAMYSDIINEVFS